MPAYLKYSRSMRSRERALALAAVVIVQLALGLALLTGLRVQFSRAVEGVQRLVQIDLPQVPPPPVAIEIPKRQERRREAAPKAEPKPLGGSPGPQPAHAPPSVTPVIAVQPTVAPSGGGTGTGPARGSGSGGGTGGSGYGDGDGGGTDAEQIAGAITPSDYPRNLRRAGIGGTVYFVFTVGANGRVTRCGLTRSSGVAELDVLTCRLVMQRFVYRPSTDNRGRPVPTEVDGEHEWVARRY
jgi:periplasmic protein TonB